MKLAGQKKAMVINMRVYYMLVWSVLSFLYHSQCYQILYFYLHIVLCISFVENPWNKRVPVPSSPLPVCLSSFSLFKFIRQKMQSHITVLSNHKALCPEEFPMSENLIGTSFFLFSKLFFQILSVIAARSHCCWHLFSYLDKMFLFLLLLIWHSAACIFLHDLFTSICVDFTFYHGFYLFFYPFKTKILCSHVDELVI